MFLRANWASAWANHANGLDTQKVGSFNATLSTPCSDPGILDKVCEKAMKEISTADVCDQVQEAILKSLKAVRNLGEEDEDFEKSHFAVRSSAAGEDGTEASSAGQMETVLGVVGYRKVRLQK
ncbi:phosphoenolpyruvate synthase [Plakobranchus ocellatus]|uniref:Phosphoenolpyruvate synthase n=1 Tax=Plakobranchus ocellatus TaxID=259542 RepID=A0AAV4DT40_9GAST|nr:phosphoenolpyruvate synthase [Plakobranchus ocellatus]